MNQKKLFTGIAALICGLLTANELPTTAEVALDVEREIDRVEHPMPMIEPLFDYHIRDVSICKGPEGKYFLTGTTDDNWGIADGIRVWESDDLKNWKILGENGYVWTFEKDGHPWQKEIALNERVNRRYRGIWAPEIHYFKGTFWIPYSCSNVHDSGLLKSVSGKAEGPYVDIKTDGPLVEGIDATLVEDEHGDIWYVWAHGRVHKMNEDMSGFEGEEYPALYAEGGGKVGYEGVNIFRYGGKYHLIAAEWNTEGPMNGHELRNTGVNRRCADGRYDCMIATSDALLGPYSEAYIAVPHAGHNVLFTDHEDHLWATMFGNDEAAAPFREDPAIVPLDYNEQIHRFSPSLPYEMIPPFQTEVLYVDADGKDGDGSSWASPLCDLQTAIDRAGPNTQIWVKSGNYAPVVIRNKEALRMFGGFDGSETLLTDRKLETLSALGASEDHDHVVIVENSPYFRWDGFAIGGGFADGKAMDSHGAGMLILGGGETIRITNCVFAENIAQKNGGAVYVGEGASPLFINCLWQDNESVRNGAAIAVEADRPNGYHVRVYHSRFKGNYSGHHGGAVYMRTIHKQTGLLRLINCEIDGNQSLLEKGVLTLEGGANLLMSHCSVTNNRGMANGAVVASLGRIPAQNRIVNCVFENNRGGFLFDGDGFDPGTKPTWAPKNRAWTEFVNNAFGRNEVRALLRRSYDSRFWYEAEELNAEKLGTENRGNTNLEVLINAGSRSNSFKYDLNGRERACSVRDMPDLGLFER